MWIDRVLELRRVPGREIADCPHQWKVHPQQQLEALEATLDEVGFAGALLCYYETDGTLTTVDGHGRKALDPDYTYPCLITDLKPEEVPAVITTYDPIAHLAQPDMEKLRMVAERARDSARSDRVRSLIDAIRERLAGKVDVLPEPGNGGDEFEPDEAAPCRVQVGDVWLIGGVHRLICGDCTDPATVDRLIQGERADAVFTSPPYDQQRTYEGHMAADWIGLMRGVFSAVLSCLNDDAQVFVNLGLVHRDGRVVRYWDAFITWMEDAAQSWPLFGWYVWDKLNGMPGDWSGRLAPAHEWVFHFTREGVRPDKTVKTKDGNRTGGTQRNPDGTLKKFTHACAPVQPFKIPDSVVRTPQVTGPREYGDHPAPFPLALPETFIEAYNVDLWLDPFLGSGTTIIAAHRTGRRCYGCEISPEYCEVILQRCEAEGLTVEKVEA